MTDTLFPIAPPLTERQAQVYDLTEHGPLTPSQAGVALHLAFPSENVAGWTCGCGPDRECQWARSNGREVLEALKRKGLLRRDRHHVYRRPDADTGSQGDLPEGF